MTVPAVVIAAAASLALALIPSIGGQTLGSFLPDFGVTVEASELLRGTEQLADDDLSAAQWGQQRDRLHELLEAARVADDKERFRLVAQIGRAASLAGELEAPYFVPLKGRMTNRYLAEAAEMNDASEGALLSLASPGVVQLIVGADVVAARSVEEVVTLAAHTAAIPWNALSESDWADRASELLASYVQVRDRLDGPELLAVLLQLGRAAENANQAAAPYYETVAGQSVNVPWLAAATLVVARPSLSEDISDRDLRAQVEGLAEMVRSGALPARNREDVPSR